MGKGIWATLLALMLAGAAGFATAQAMPDVEGALMECYVPPTGRAGPDDVLEVEATLGAESELIGRPVVLSPKTGAPGERALFRQVQEALLDCTPLRLNEAGTTYSGTIYVTATLEGLRVSAGTAQVVVALEGAPEVAEATPAPEAAGDADAPALAADEAAMGADLATRREIQRRLTLLGFDTKGVDGQFGPGTRAAISAWQATMGFPETGYLSAAQRAALESATSALYADWIASNPEPAPGTTRSGNYRGSDGCARTRPGNARGTIILGRSHYCNLRALRLK